MTLSIIAYIAVALLLARWLWRVEDMDFEDRIEEMLVSMLVAIIALLWPLTLPLLLIGAVARRST